jgi:effector-binding domain-containing protein
MVSAIEQHRNELEVLLLQFVDEVVNIASSFHQQTKFYYIEHQSEDGEELEDLLQPRLDFLSSFFMSSKDNFKPFQKEIQIAEIIISKAKDKIKFGHTIAPIVHKRNLLDIGAASDEVVFTMTKQFKEIKNEGLEIYKSAELVYFRYRALLQEFNSVIFEYKRIHPDTPLHPLYASLDLRLDI